MSRQGTKILRRMLEVIPDARHWTKGSYQRHKYEGTPQEVWAFCLVGAAREAKRQTGLYGEPYSEALKRLQRAVDGGYPVDLTQWNDSPGRRYPEVRAVIERAIKIR